MSDSETQHTRLSDLILSALQLSIAQEDTAVSKALSHALELSMTRNAGGGEFVERRDYPAEVEEALKRLGDLSAN